jgi:hypothetical protein
LSSLVKHRLFLSDPACKQVLMLRTLALALVFGTTVLFGSLYAQQNLYYLLRNILFRNIPNG